MIKRLFALAKVFSPELKMGAGAAIATFATVELCKDTLKAEDILATYYHDTETIAEAKRRCPDKYSAKDERGDKITVTYRLIRGFVKNYAFDFVLYLLGFGLMFSSNAEHKANSMSASAALAALTEAHNLYRRRVADKYGEEAERDIALAVEQKKVTVETVDEEGKTKKSTKSTKYIPANKVETNPFLLGAYTYIWDAGSSWEFDKNDPFWNKNFLGQALDWANNTLVARSDSTNNTPGYLYLDEVLKALGMELSRDDMQKEKSAGWLYFPNGNNPIGDNHVDFGLLETMRDPNGDICFMNADAINGYEPAWLLNFNCQGDIRALLRQYA